MDTKLLIFTLMNEPGFQRATFAGSQRGTVKTPWDRVTVRPVQIRNERLFQFSYFDGRNTLVHNDDFHRRVAELSQAQFAGVHLTTANEEIDIRTTKKGQVTVGRTSRSGPVDVDLSHNRVKETLLSQSENHNLLMVMGIAAKDGSIKPTMRAKYVQINEFLKHLSHAIDDASLTGPLSILDCGCGSSYLTLAAHHYLNHVRKQPATLIGVDVNDELIRKSIAKAEHLNAEGLQFRTGTIGSTDIKPDIVLALHACDTATDDALMMAVESEAKVILAVPCCHRAINRQMKSNTPELLTPILRHGLLRERLADLATDALRAQALRVMGYRAEVVEFVAPEYTPKNLMIRAVRVGPAGDAKAKAEFIAMKEYFGVEAPIERIWDSGRRGCQ